MTAAAANWIFTADQGKTLTKRLRFGSRSGNTFIPFDNTGYQARMMWKKTYQTSTPAVDVSSLTGEIVLGGANGEITFTLPASLMEDLLGKYVFDIELYQGTPPNEVVIAPVRGEVTVKPEVTT